MECLAIILFILVIFYCVFAFGGWVVMVVWNTLANWLGFQTITLAIGKGIAILLMIIWQMISKYIEVNFS